MRVCISKAVIAVALALVLYVGSRSLLEALDAGLLTRVDVLRVYVDAVGVRVNQTNRYISDDAVYLNDVVRAVYSDQMRSELLNLQSLVDFFNAGIVSLFVTYLLTYLLTYLFINMPSPVTVITFYTTSFPLSLKDLNTTT